MILDIVFLIAGFAFLVLGGNWLLKSSVALSLKLSIPKMVVGLTVVSFATSAPELIVSINAALKGSSDISLGNVIGSNIANLGLVLAVTTIIMPIDINKYFYRSDWAFMLLASFLLVGLVYFDEVLNRWEGILLFGILVSYILYLLKLKGGENLEHEIDDLGEGEEEMQWIFVALFLILGGTALWGGSELLVNGARNIALAFEIPESVIGLTVVAIGTSVPELAASVVAAIKNEKSISLGNLIGSNIFNILCVLGITSVILPVEVQDARFLTNDIWWMMGIALALFPLGMIFKKYQIGRLSGVVLLTSYVIYVYLAF